MFGEAGLGSKKFVAMRAFKWLFIRVNTFMGLKIILLYKRPVAKLTRVRSNSGVNFVMLTERITGLKRKVTFFTLKRSLVHMSGHMSRKCP